MKRFAIILLALTLVASMASAEKPKDYPADITYVGDNTALAGGEDIATAVAIGALPFNDSGSTVGAIDDYQRGFGDAPDHVYSFTPAVDFLLDVSLCSSSYDTRLWIMEADLTEIAYNDDGCSLQSEILGAALTAGVTYYIVVDGYSSNSGEYVIDVDGVPDAGPQPGDTCELAVDAVEGLNDCPGAPFWYKFTVPIDDCIWISSCIDGQSVDTRVYVYSDCEETLIDFDDDDLLDTEACTYSLASYLEVPVTSGQVVYIWWDGYWNDSDPFQWTLGVNGCVVSTEEATWGGVKSLYR